MSDPETVMAEIKQIGRAHGFADCRIDRLALPDNPKVWFEVGYGCKEFTVRYSDPDLFGGRYRISVEQLRDPKNQQHMRDHLHAVFATLAKEPMP